MATKNDTPTPLPPVPERMPLLPYRSRVLLPGAIVLITCSSPSSIRLVEQELWNKRDMPLVGVVPVLKTGDKQLAAGSGRRGTVESSKEQEAKEEEDEGDRWRVGEEEDFQQQMGGKPQVAEEYTWHSRGVAARTLHVARGSGKGGMKVAYHVVLEGLERIEVKSMSSRGPYTVARVSRCERGGSSWQEDSSGHMQRLGVELRNLAAQLVSLQHKDSSPRLAATRRSIESAPPALMADVMVACFEPRFPQRLQMLDATLPSQRLLTAIDILAANLKKLKEVAKAQKKESRSERDGEEEDDEDDMSSLESKMEEAKLPANVWKHVKRELRRLRKMQPQQPGYSSTRQYLELLADLPWQRSHQEGLIDLAAAQRRLDTEHFGLLRVKQRIVEYIAVKKLKPDAVGPVLCFVGPPGVGKTSLASSIAAALGRRFVRIALGGVKDEADIRGHRRTYVGSMPGRVVEGLKRVGCNNPVMLLDEIDKTGADARGDPSAALLEVLDPEQNRAFTDHYLGVPFDISRVVFLATANRSSPIPPALLDRMEVIELPGYTPEEKQRIATSHLIPRVLEQNGLTAANLLFPNHVVEMVIRCYTREAGVRNLSRQLAAIARAAAVQVAQRSSSDELGIRRPESGGEEGGGGGEVEVEAEAVGMKGEEVVQVMVGEKQTVVTEAMLEDILGPPKFDGSEAAERVAMPGVAVGLVWTAVGGEVQFVEATSMAGKGELHLTGQLGDVIKESAQIALTWVRSRASDFLSAPPSVLPAEARSVQEGKGGRERGLATVLTPLPSPSSLLPSAPAAAATAAAHLMQQRDVHIHFPAGAVPKDGPSAGVTLVTALVSLLTQRCVRADTAMTGEITLRGLTLPVGGIKDKILAAHRYGVRRVILPEKNIKDLKEVPSNILACMEILPTKTVEDVLREAFDDGCPIKLSCRL